MFVKENPDRKKKKKKKLKINLLKVDFYSPVTFLIYNKVNKKVKLFASRSFLISYITHCGMMDKDRKMKFDGQNDVLQCPVIMPIEEV